MTEKPNKKIQFKLEEISNQFLTHLKETIDCVNYLYNAVNENPIQNKPLPTDSLPVYIDDKQKSLSANEQKEKTINWLFKKAFEEFIAGLTKSLIEAYRFVKLRNLSLNPFPGTNTQLEQEIKKIDTDANKTHFPKLIEHIENGLGHPLYMRDEILSINRVRNCVVHRDGIVKQKDLKDAGADTLTLKWKSINFYTDKNGKPIILNVSIRPATYTEFSHRPGIPA